MDTWALRAIKAAGAEIVARKLNCARVFEMDAVNEDWERACLTCANIVTVDTELKIRHGSALFLRKLKWLVADQPDTYPCLDAQC